MHQYRWTISIDTGGTFTDCLALDPTNKLQRIKVLSDGSLRGHVISVKSNTLTFNARWPTTANIFSGYTLRFPADKLPDFTIRHCDLINNKIETLEEISGYNLDQLDFQITAGEEAPVLCARIATSTPLDQDLPPIELRLGSTRGTNALLESKGAKTALLITKGFADLLKIGTQQRPELFSLEIIKKPLLNDLTIEVNERLDANGQLITALDDQSISKIIVKLKNAGIESVAIALMHSYLNPVHEKYLEKQLRKNGFHYVSLSSRLAPVIKILPRAETALVNAYLSEVITNYLHNIRLKAGQRSFKVMTSAGGLVDSKLFTPKDSLLSGPAGGVVGAYVLGEKLGETKLLAFDMGGTSTDVSRIDGALDYTYDFTIGNAHLLSPALSIETVAAGGGSICRFDGKKFTVGPESAGAFPGPACYGAGGPLSITDVNLLLGHLDPEKFGIPVSRQYSLEAFNDLMEDSNTDIDAKDKILQGFLDIANEKMAETIRKISFRKGYDTSDFTLLSFGGAGGQHACSLGNLLNIKKIIAPYDGGLLSAYGIQKAQTERITIRQILKNYLDVVHDLSSTVEALIKEAYLQMQQEGFSESEVQVNQISLFFRFRGQDETIEIDYQNNEDLLGKFRNNYQSLYGHWLDNQPIELESIKVRVSDNQAMIGHDELPDKLYYPEPVQKSKIFLNDHWTDGGVYDWDLLEPGAIIHEPGLLISTTSTIFIDKGWSLKITNELNAILEKQEEAANTVINKRPEAIELELFTNRFKAIAEDMGSILQRTSFSVNVKERMDFSCAILDQNGYLVVNAPHIPVHLGSLGICTRAILEKINPEPGDVIITNHPRYGGSHLPDITLVAPVFDQTQKLIGYVANRAHHAEIGGKTPGSMPTNATTLAEEGCVIRPVYLVRNGNSNWSKIEEMLTSNSYPTRALAENLADLRGALASVNSGIQSLKNLSLLHGTAKVVAQMQKLKIYAAETLSDAVKSMYGSYLASENLDDGSPLKVAIEINDQKIKFDFSGCGSIHPGNFNATPAIVNSCIIYCLRLIITEKVLKNNDNQPEIPLNEGLMNLVEINLPTGMLNPDFPDDPHLCPAVVGGNTEVSQRLVDTILKAFRIVACSQGTMNNLLFGNQYFGYYETLGGGTGAGEGFHGASGVHQHMTNTKITDPEIMEIRYPVRIHQFSLRENSGGKGLWNGGNGLTRKIEFLEPLEVTWLTQHRKIEPYGCLGGEAGKTGQQIFINKSGKRNKLETIGNQKVNKGEIIFIETPGGGAYGIANKK